jgi:RHS repeat-associated protein
MVAIGADSQAVTRRRQTPFGESRGTEVDFPGSKGFVGGTEDDSTDLTHLGAREYDASTGRFITVDPVMDLSDPQQMQGYSYANNNPVTYSDPSGRAFCICGHAGPPPPPPTAATREEVPDIKQKPKAQKPTVTNQRLQAYLDHIYPEAKDVNWIGSGKGADALRNELLTGRETNKKWHETSVAQDFRGLVGLLEDDDIARATGGQVLTGPDRDIAINEAKELWGALNQEDSRGVLTRKLQDEPGRKEKFDSTMKAAAGNKAFTHVTDAQYYQPEKTGPRNNPPVYKNKGATTRGFMRGMGALSVLPMVIDIAKGPTPGASPTQQMEEGFCVFDMLGVCDSLMHPTVGGIA